MLTFYYVCLISLLSLSHTHAGTFKISKVIDNMCLYCYVTLFKGFLVAQTVKKILLQCRRLGLIPGLGKSLGEGNGYSLPYSCLENPMNKGGWWITIHGVTKNQTQLNDQEHIPYSNVTYYPNSVLCIKIIHTVWLMQFEGLCSGFENQNYPSCFPPPHPQPVLH